MLADDLLTGLNPEQAEAVRSSEGPLLVLAGAGSGKTRVLTQRIAWLVGVNGLAPESLLAVTFTNKAAGEMRERVEKLLGMDARGVWLSTFHSSCVRILRREIEALGRERNFVIYDEADSRAAVKQALARHELPASAADARRMRWQIDQWKNRGQDPEQARSERDDLYTRRAAEVYESYQRLLREANALDFGDLLLLTVELFDRHPEVLTAYRERWQYLLVDEYQDTNRVQYRLVKQLAGGHRNLCVVGDPDQSIYAWRGADIKNILDFERDFPDAKVVKLERNYRSTQRILSASTAVINNNTGRPQKNMITDRGDGEKLILYEARDDRDEAQYVVRDIMEAALQGRSLGQCAVFYRTNAQSRTFEEELLKYDVPYVVVGGVRFYDRAEVKDALAWLRVLLNPADNQALRRIVNRPPRGIGKTTIARADALSDACRGSLLEAMRLLLQRGEAGRAASKVRAFIALLDELAAELPELGPADALARVLERSGYQPALEKERTPESEARLENLRELLTGAEDFEDANANEASDERSPCARFLDQVSLVSDVDTANFDEQRVSLMTVHAAKGLEFELVWLVGMEEGLFPLHATESDTEQMEEERRLCYVGMTRAMEKLCLCYALERRRYGSHSFSAPSRFLSELPREELEVKGVRRAPALPGSHVADGERRYDYSFEQHAEDAGAEGAGGIAAGVRVRHRIYGAGTVLKVEGKGPRQKLSVRFDHAGVKKLVLRYANLELI